jgi:hypothetical protein
LLRTILHDIRKLNNKLDASKVSERLDGKDFLSQALAKIDQRPSWSVIMVLIAVAAFVGAWFSKHIEGES